MSVITAMCAVIHTFMQVGHAPSGLKICLVKYASLYRMSSISACVLALSIRCLSSLE